MNWLQRKRLYQVIKFGWKDSREISRQTGKSRLAVYVDILRCFKGFYLFSNQYKQMKMWELIGDERQRVGIEKGEKNRYKDDWVVEQYETKRFLAKYSSLDYDSTPKKQQKRLEAYTKKYNFGKDCHVSYGLIIHRNHFLPGKMVVGNNVKFVKNVYIDYSGELIIHDRVVLTQGVIIETHHRDLEAYASGRDVNIPTKLEICENAYIGTNAIILDSCNYIGKNCRIGAGAVVTKDIPDNSVAVGVPAKVVKTIEN